MIDKEQVRNIVKKVLDEEHLLGLNKIFEKEHNIFRGSHDKIGLPETLVIPQTIVNQIVEKFETGLTEGSIPFIDEDGHFTEVNDELFYEGTKKILCLGLNSPETDMVGGYIVKEGTPPTVNIEDAIQVYALGPSSEGLTDGGLEEWLGAEDLTYWIEFDGGAFEEGVYKEATEVHGGSFSCKLHTEVQGDYAGFYQDFTLTPGSNCKATVWYLRTAHPNSDLRLYILTGPGYNTYLRADGTWGTAEPMIWLTTTEIWKKFELEFKAHPDYSNYRIRFYKSHGSGGPVSFYIDDVSVGEIGDTIPYFRTSTGIVIGLNQDMRTTASVIHAGLTLTGFDGVLKAVDGVLTEAADHVDLANITSDQHHPQAHSLASHATKAHSELTNISSDQHHPQAHTLASHSTKPHSALTDITSDQHHAQLHESAHRSGGGDALDHDLLTGFVAAEHLSLPNTIAQVLSDHDKSAHDALGLDHDSLSGVSVDDHHAQSHTLASHSTKPHSALTDVTSGQHHAQLHATAHNLAGADELNHDNLAGFVLAKHLSLPSSIANVLSDHDLAAHTALGLFDEHSDVDHDQTTNFAAGEHFLQSAITTVGTIGIGVWEGTAIGWTYISKTGSNLTDLVTRLHSSLQSIGVDDHHSQAHTLASHSTKPHSALTGVTSDQHHAQAHVLDGAYHSISGKTPGHFLKALTATTFGFAAHGLIYSDVGAAATSHNHVRSNITDFWDSSFWANIPDKPSSFPPSSHNHDERYYTEDEIDTLLAGYNEFTELTDTPSSYTGQAGKFVKVNAIPDGLEFVDIVAGDLPSHTHVKANITDTPWAWGDVSKVGSNLTNLATRQHVGLTDITSDQHHPQSHTLASHSTKAHSELTGIGTGDHHAQLHGSSHHSGGGDAVKLDDLASPDDNVDLNASTVKHGLLMKLGGGTTNFLRADGNWAVPAGGNGGGYGKEVIDEIFDSLADGDVHGKGVYSGWAAWNTDVEDADCSAQIIANPGNGKMLRLSDANVNGLVNTRLDAAAGREIVQCLFKCKMRISTFADTNNRGYIGIWDHLAAHTGVYFKDNTLQWWTGADASVIMQAVADTWYSVEVFMDCTAAKAVIWVDGVLRLTLASCLIQDIKSFTFYTKLISPAGGYTVDFDDLLIVDLTRKV